MQKIAYENQLMLGRLIKGKSTMSVTNWEKSHQARQKLLKRFGLHPYVLNQKPDNLDPNQTYLSKGAGWQSSTRLSAEDNVSKYNFPLGSNYPSHVSAGGAAGLMSTTGNSFSQNGFQIRDNETNNPTDLLSKGSR